MEWFLPRRPDKLNVNLKEGGNTIAHGVGIDTFGLL
jgi:hypothetical protein